MRYRDLRFILAIVTFPFYLLSELLYLFDIDIEIGRAHV